jgi:hypothetical protein
MSIGVALRVDFCSLSLVLSRLANDGSSTFTMALVSDDEACPGMRIQLTFTSKPKARRVSTVVAGVVPGGRPVMHATEKSAGRDTLIT